MKALLALTVAALALAGCTNEIRDQYADAFSKDLRLKQQAWDRADDAECQRQGAQPASDFYQLCRKRLADKHIAEEEELDRARMGVVR